MSRPDEEPEYPDVVVPTLDELVADGTLTLAGPPPRFVMDVAALVRGHAHALRGVAPHVDVLERELQWARDAHAAGPGTPGGWERQRSLAECYRQVAHIMRVDPPLGIALLTDLDRELGAD